MSDDYRFNSKGEIRQRSLIHRAEAKKLGNKTYFTGIPCPANHVSERYTKGGGCVKCMSDRQKIRREIHREEMNERSREYRANNLELTRQQHKNYRDRHKERRKALNRAAKLRAKERDPYSYKLNKNISWGIWRSLKQNKEGRSWTTLVNFTLHELILHLESQFKEGMTWENYGSAWHVDHVTPLSWFNLQNPEEFNKCWALSNLQPLESDKNLSKGNRYAG